MSLTDEQKRLQSSCLKMEQNILTAIDKDAASYWKDAEECESYVMEFGCSTPLEMMESLKPFFTQDEIIRVVTAAAFTNRSLNRDAAEKAGNKTAGGRDDATLPEYVYNF